MIHAIAVYISLAIVTTNSKVRREEQSYQSIYRKRTGIFMNNFCDFLNNMLVCSLKLLVNVD